jgi:hypothetical protein
MPWLRTLIKCTGGIQTLENDGDLPGQQRLDVGDRVPPSFCFLLSLAMVRVIISKGP